MSGTTNQLGDTGLLAGIGTLAIDGTLYNINDPTYSESTMEYEYLIGYNGPHGRKATYVVGFIACKIRDSATMLVSDFQGMTNSEVLLTLANGKVVTCTSGWVTELGALKTAEGTFDLHVESGDVTEDTV